MPDAFAGTDVERVDRGTASPVGRLLRCPDACPAPLDDLDALVDDIIVDAYGDDEPQVAFVEVFNQEAQLPAAAAVLGMPVEVVGFDYRDGRRASSPSAGGTPRIRLWLSSI